MMLDLYTQIVAAGLPEPECEFRFHPKRKWRFDLAWPEIMVAVEIEGGTWTGGRHVRGKGFERDCEKYNAAAILGWTLLRFTPAMIRSGVALATLQAVLLAIGPDPDCIPCAPHLAMQ